MSIFLILGTIGVIAFVLWGFLIDFMMNRNPRVPNEQELQEYIEQKEAVDPLQRTIIIPDEKEDEYVQELKKQIRQHKETLKEKDAMIKNLVDENKRRIRRDVNRIWDEEGAKDKFVKQLRDSREPRERRKE